VSLSRYKPLLINLIENKITIHFVHRSLAYVLLITTVIWTIKAFKQKQLTNYFKSTRLIPLTLILLQVLLGVFTVLTSIRIVPNSWGLFQWMAELHQVTGMLFLLAMIWFIYLSNPPKS
jgi:heme a synthase